MTICFGSSSLSFFTLILVGALLTSCSVDEPAVFSIGAARTGAIVKEKKGEVPVEDKKEAAAKAKLAAAGQKWRRTPWLHCGRL